MGFFVLLLLIIGVIVIISTSSSGHSSGGNHGGYVRDYDDDYEDYEIRAAKGDREYFSDASRMFCIGNVSADKKRLVKTAKEAIQVGLMEVKPFAPLGNMGHAIHMYAKSQGYTVVEEIGGHGVGLEFHEDPVFDFPLFRFLRLVVCKESGIIEEESLLFRLPFPNRPTHLQGLLNSNTEISFVVLR